MGNNEQDKMNLEQYRAICQMINCNDEENKMLVKEVKGVLSEKIEVHMGYIRDSITDMNDTLKMHNSRLRKMEVAEERRKGRDEILIQRMNVMEKGLENQVEFCGQQRVDTKDLSKLEEWINWVKQHPIKFMSLALPILFTVLVIANAVYHWLDKLL